MNGFSSPIQECVAQTLGGSYVPIGLAIDYAADGLDTDAVAISQVLLSHTSTAPTIRWERFGGSPDRVDLKSLGVRQLGCADQMTLSERAVSTLVLMLADACLPRQVVWVEAQDTDTPTFSTMGHLVLRGGRITPQVAASSGMHRYLYTININRSVAIASLGVRPDHTLLGVRGIFHDTPEERQRFTLTGSSEHRITMSLLTPMAPAAHSVSLHP